MNDEIWEAIREQLDRIERHARGINSLDDDDDFAVYTATINASVQRIASMLEDWEGEQ